MRKRSWIVLFALVVTLPACGPSRKSVFPVKGKVTDADGKPAVGAQVIFHRVNSDPNDKETISAVGTTDQSGEYTLTTYNKDDGAPEGDYTVTVTWPAEKKTPGPGLGPDRLNGQYANVASSQIKRKVSKSGPNEMEPIKVSITPAGSPAGGRQGRRERE
jgi:hypothetical protein